MEKLIDALQLPKDLMLGALNVRLIGEYEAYIENYKSIIEYNDEVICLQGKNSKVTIKGERLKIVCFSKDDMRIKGFLHEVIFN